MTTRQRYEAVIQWFETAMPSPVTELDYGSPYQLLVAVVLSAQCTDKRVNMVTPALFDAFPAVQDMAMASADDIYPYIKSVSYPNNKARSLAGAARVIVDEFGGEIPCDIDALLTIPGVGRKTANVLLSVLWGKAAMAVDTHVFRVSERLGLTQGSKSPLETERTLVSHIPEAIIPKAHHWLILHGRYVCKARRPDCMNCGLTPVCRYFQKTSSKE